VCANIVPEPVAQALTVLFFAIKNETYILLICVVEVYFRRKDNDKNVTPL